MNSSTVISESVSSKTITEITSRLAPPSVEAKRPTSVAPSMRSVASTASIAANSTSIGSSSESARSGAGSTPNDAASDWHSAACSVVSSPIASSSSSVLTDTPPRSPKALSETSSTEEPEQQKDGDNSRRREAIVSERSAAGGPVSENHHREQLNELTLCFVKLSGMHVDAPASDRLARSLNFLRSCGYHMQDIILVLAHASAYCSDIRGHVGQMQPKETTNVLMVLMFLAHSYVLDVHCPLRTWHHYLFRDYCELTTLERASISLLKLKGYVLRVPDEVVEARANELSAWVMQSART